MRKMLLFCAPMILLLLCSCGATAGQTENLQTQYQNVQTASMEAEITSHLEKDDRTFTLRCDYDAAGKSTISVLAPADMADLSAVVEGDKLSLAYDGTCLDAGLLGDVCAADCLPRLMRAAATGYVTERGEEKIDGIPCLRVVFDVTGGSGGKVNYAVWFAQSDLTPHYMEISTGGTVILSGVFHAFTVGETAG